MPSASVGCRASGLKPSGFEVFFFFLGGGGCWACRASFNRASEQVEGLGFHMGSSGSIIRSGSSSSNSPCRGSRSRTSSGARTSTCTRTRPRTTSRTSSSCSSKGFQNKQGPLAGSAADP